MKTLRTARRLSGGALLTALAALAACSGDAAAPTAAPPGGGQELIERVVELGFRRDQIVDEGDHFRVEGDIIIRKTDLAGPRASRVRAPDAPRLQWHTTNLVSQATMARGIRVSLAGISHNSQWTTAARYALLSWSGTTGTKIFFSEAAPADITFSFGNIGSLVAQAGFPANGLPGGTVTISNAYANSLSLSQKQFILVHELGHTIGYRHSNWQAMGEPQLPDGATQVPGTPTTDAASVMRTGVSPVPTYAGFSANDQVANQYLYPGPSPTLISQGYDGSGHPQLSWTPVADVAGYRVRMLFYVYEFVPDGPYWAWNPYFAELGVVTGTSFTDLNETYTGSSACTPSYFILPVYASGKEAGMAESQVYQTC